MLHHAHVYRSDLGDCTNGGISAFASSLRVIEMGDPMPKNSHVERLNFPVAMLVHGNVAGTAKIVPVDPQGLPLTGGMFGGNYASTSDGRWGAAVNAIAGSRQPGPVPIHDRFE